MTRTSLDDAQWVSLMLVMQQIPLAWKRDEVALRRFVEAALWICRTGAPWRDLPECLGLWSSVYHRWRRWCLRGWWEVIFEALRPSLPADGCTIHTPQARHGRSTRMGSCAVWSAPPYREPVLPAQGLGAYRPRRSR